MSVNLSIVFIFSLLGVGAAAPIGPVNIEIIRRNLHLGLLTAMLFGSGACLADVTYLILLLTGFLTFIESPVIFCVLGIIGSLVIGVFGVKTFFDKSIFVDKAISKISLPQQFLSGYFMTLLNPFTILFWVSVSAQIAIYQHKSSHAAFLGGVGVLAGTLVWVITVNFLVHFSRKLITGSVMQIINYVSGVILIGIGLFGEYQAIYKMINL